MQVLLRCIGVLHWSADVACPVGPPGAQVAVAPVLQDPGVEDGGQVVHKDEGPLARGA